MINIAVAIISMLWIKSVMGVSDTLSLSSTRELGNKKPNKLTYQKLSFITLKHTSHNNYFSKCF